ncbi:ras-related protein Rab-44 isoform X1 [Numida meleagris]|uniref:ras-related protein Rab-44 isoform X1 n=1 Tax=Numida meleagris TaxID=8996 RepID=UPI000B3DA60E|nr:ras-related protein Rab-44 isoform X1 [Numida meleagris]
MAEQRAGTRGRRMGSSRRRQLRKDLGEEPPWAAAVMQRVQDIIQEQHGDTEGFITRADMQKLQEVVVPCSTEELELLFDGMDAAGTGQLSAEEFTAGLRQFLSSQKASKEHRRRKAASRRSCLVLASPTWEEMDSEERKHFAAFMEQLGVDDRWEEHEIWQLWAKLRNDEPQLLGNLEAFLAKMRHRIQEARSKKEALEEALNKRVAEHNREVQQLCEALEQQIQEERQRMEQESTARSRLHCAMLQRALDAREKELQRLVAVQEELEARCRSVLSTQRAASAENRQLEESNRALEEQLQHIHAQLQQTHECLRAAMARQRAEEPRDGAEAELPGEMLPSPQMSREQHRSEMHIRPSSEGSEPKRRSTHHVVWEKPPADTSTTRLLSVEEDPFPEFLKEERFSGQGSLLREMSDAIAALSTQKLQAPGDAAQRPQDDAEPHAGPRGSAPRETHISHKVLEEDPREGRAAAELRAGDGTQAGASAGAVHRRAQEQGAAEGDSAERAGQSPEQVLKVLSVQGKGAGGEQEVLKEVESPQEAPGESTEMGEQAWVGVEGAGWVQGRMKWEKVQLPGEGENVEAVLKAQEVELPVGCSATEVLQVLGEHLEPEVPGWGEVQMAAVQGVTEAPNPAKVDGEGRGAVGHSWGETKGTELQPLSAAGDLGTEQAESVEPDVQLVEEVNRAEPELEEGAEAAAVLGEELSPVEIPAGSPVPGSLVLVSAQAIEMEEAEDSPAETLLHGGPSLEAPRDGGDHTAMHLGEDAEDGEQLLAELGEIRESLEAELQPLSAAGDLGTEQAESMEADVQLLGEVGKPEFVEMEGAENSQVHMQLQWGPSQEVLWGEGGHTAVQLTQEAEDEGQDIQHLKEEREMEVVQEEGTDQDELVLVSAQALEKEEGEDSLVQTLLHGGPSSEAPRDGLDDTAMHLGEDAEDGEQLLAELGEIRESLEAELQPLSAAGDLGTEQAESVEPDVQLLEEADRAEPELEEGAGASEVLDEELSPVEIPARSPVPGMWVLEFSAQAIEMEEGEDSPVEILLHGGPSLEALRDGLDDTAMHLGEDAEDGEQLLAELGEIRESLETELQPLSAAGDLGTEQAESVGPDVQLLEEADRAEPELEEGAGAAVVLDEELSPVEIPARSPVPGMWVLEFSAQAIEMEEGEDSPAEILLHGGPSSEALRDGLDDTATHLGEDAEDRGQLLAELGEIKESLEAELQPRSAAGELGTEQAESVGADVQLVEEADRAEPEPEEGAGAAVVLGEGLSPVEITAGSPAPGGLVLVSAQELERKEAESLVQLEELTLSHGDSTGADGKPLGAAGLWEGAESPAVALEASPCMAHNTDVWDGDAEAALHAEYAAAAEHAHPRAVLVAVSGPDEQILEETQRESTDAEGRSPLDGAQGLEVVRGARLEAEAKILVAAQHLELKQGRDDASAATLASPVSEVPLQIRVLRLDAMMQEDVLVPDVQRLGGSGQAAQEQVSAQADKGRLHAAPRQLQKPPGVMEAAARPAEAPKQEVPPASALHTGIQRGEDAAEDLSGMALGDSPEVEAVSSRVQPHRQLSGEQREDLDVGQLEKKQEMEQRMRPGGEAGPGEPGAEPVNGAGAASKGSLEPDHLYNVLFVGDSHVGKTSFLYRLHADAFNPHLAATVGLDYQVKNLVVDNKRFALRLWDSAGQERYHSITKQFFRKADGVVLMYDVTSQYSFADVRYWLSCIQEGAEDGVTVLLLGNKIDCAAERQVPTQEGERLAQEHQLLFYECSAASGHNVTESIISLVRALKVCEDRLRNKAEEVPKLPQKKKGCCW